MELLALLNRFDNSLRPGQVGESARHAMKALIDYVRTHFSYEEQLMHESGYPQAQNHHVEHLRLLETLASYDLQLKTNPSFDVQHLLLSLHGWLINHILESDKHLGRFLRANDRV